MVVGAFPKKIGVGIMRCFLLFALGVLTLSAPSFAGVEADLALGRRWAETNSDGKSHGVQMDETVFSARYGILDTGLSVGPAISYSKVRAQDLTASKAANYELGLEAKYGFSVLPWLAPYAKARYTAYSRGTMKVSNDDVDATLNYRTEGAHFSVGAAFSVAPMVNLIAEAGYSAQMIRTTGGTCDKIKAGSVLERYHDREDFNSKSFMVGVNVALN